jgi:hypothetical protein
VSFPIQTQSQQFAGFDGDPTRYAQRDRVAVFDVDGDVHDYLAGPSIQAGLLNTRTAVDVSQMPPNSHAYHQDQYAPVPSPNPRFEPDGYAEEPMYPGEAEDDQSGYNWGPAPQHDPGAEPGPDPNFHDGQPHPFGTPVYHPGGSSFSTARHRTADDGGSDLPAFTPNLYSPERRQDANSMLLGGEPEHWVTAAAVTPAQPAAPAAPVWLGHSFVPAHRVGMPWRGQTLPGTVTHLDGTNVGVRWDDGQHSVEEPSAIHPLY